MGIRSEYRRRYDSNAAALQDAQAELEENRRADIQRIANQAEQQREQRQRVNGEPPWQAELDDYEAVRQAGMVSAPPSRTADSYS